jgi:hypothetical protein
MEGQVGFRAREHVEGLDADGVHVSVARSDRHYSLGPVDAIASPRVAA